MIIAIDSYNPIGEKMLPVKDYPELREKILKIMKENPEPIHVYARKIGIASRTLTRFIRGEFLSNMCALKIENYTEKKGMI